MYWIAILAIIIFSIILVYLLFRYDHRFRIGLLPIDQFYTAYIATPIASVAVFNLALSSTSRPEVARVPLTSSGLLTLLVLSMILTAAGLAIHTTHNTLTRFLYNQKGTPAWKANEFFHLHFSHRIAYTGAVAIFTILALLEVNHPLLTPETRPMMYLTLGLLLGSAGGMGVFLSGEMGLGIILGTISSLILIPLTTSLFSDLGRYPFLLISVVSSMVLLIVSFAAELMLHFSHDRVIRIACRISPRGHPARRRYRAKERVTYSEVLDR
jgi:hypothetical protein